MRNYYIPGEWNAICDRCGFKYKASMLREEWQGLMTCPTCWEAKHPSLLQASINPTADIPWARAEGTDIFLPETPSPTPPPPAPVGGPPTIAVQAEPTDVLQVGDHIVHENVWNAVGLTRGTYTGLTGTTYEQYIGVKYPTAPANDPVALRMVWKFPNGTTEVKSYPSIITGNFPGWFQPGTPNIAGTWPLRLENGTYSTVIPSGKTPNTVFPKAIPLAAPLTATFKFAKNTVPSGKGHLSFDIWVQDSAPQTTGFTVPPITHEIMIPITYWGTPGYGSYPAGRNPTWYDHDVTLDGKLYHVYYAPNFNGAWQFIVFEPHEPDLPADNTLITVNIQTFINYAKSLGWIDVPNPLSGNVGTHVVSVELGIETVFGEGDLTVYDYQLT